jgi:putative transposase
VTPPSAGRAQAVIQERLADDRKQNECLYLTRFAWQLLMTYQEVTTRELRTHVGAAKLEAVAYGPNEVWSWDITKLAGPARGVYYDLYVMLDIYSRYVVDWQVAVTETGELAEVFIADAVARLGRTPQAIHADRGTSMTSKPVAMLLADLGITRSHSRPRVSNDNPYSEAQFRTLKYCPAFPSGSGHSPTRARSASGSSPTTTTSTATPGSDCTPPRPSTSEPTARSAKPVPTHWTPPTNRFRRRPTPGLKILTGTGHARSASARSTVRAQRTLMPILSATL